MSTAMLAASSAGGEVRQTPAARIGLAMVEAAIAYEWLLSGLNKCLSIQYLGGLAASLNQMSSGNPNTWYVAFLRQVAIPHAAFFGVLVAAGEIVTGLALLAGAALWLRGPERLAGRLGGLVQIGVIGALVGAALMTANYYLMAGKTLPWLNPSAPFDEGLSLDGLLTIVVIGLIAVHVAAFRGSTAAARRDEAGATGPDTAVSWQRTTNSPLGSVVG